MDCNQCGRPVAYEFLHVGLEMCSLVFSNCWNWPVAHEYDHLWMDEMYGCFGVRMADWI